MKAATLNSFPWVHRRSGLSYGVASPSAGKPEDVVPAWRRPNNSAKLQVRPAAAGRREASRTSIRLSSRRSSSCSCSPPLQAFAFSRRMRRACATTALSLSHLGPGWSDLSTAPVAAQRNEVHRWRGVVLGRDALDVAWWRHAAVNFNNVIGRTEDFDDRAGGRGSTLVGIRSVVQDDGLVVHLYILTISEVELT